MLLQVKDLHGRSGHCKETIFLLALLRNVSNNSLENLELRALPQLTVLMAESNKLKVFPAGLLQASRLNTLDLSNNDLTHVPAELGLASHLTRVALLGNPLRTLRPELLRGGAEALKKFLRTRLEGQEQPDSSSGAGASAASTAFQVELRSAQGTGQLTLAERQLTALPPLPRSLKLLDVSSNHLTSGTLMSSLSEVDVLQCLRAKRNRLGGPGGDTQLMPMLASLQGLQELDLSRNGLNHLGIWQGVSAPSLTFLDLSSNGITEMSGICDLLDACPKLQELRLRQCGLSSIDILTDLRKSHRLQTLDLEENRLSSLPTEMVEALPNLKTLLLANNDLRSSLPSEFGHWESLQVVTLTGNPLKALRQALLAKGWSAVAEHLRNFGTVEVSPPAPTADSAAVLSRPRLPSETGETVQAAPKTAHVAAHVEKLHEGVRSLEERLEMPGNSRQQQSLLTHSLRMKRAELQRALRESQRVSDVAAATPRADEGIAMG
eukprot:s782_g16.t1